MKCNADKILINLIGKHLYQQALSEVFYWKHITSQCRGDYG